MKSMMCKTQNFPVPYSSSRGHLNNSLALKNSAVFFSIIKHMSAIIGSMFKDNSAIYMAILLPRFGYFTSVGNFATFALIFRMTKIRLHYHS